MRFNEEELEIIFQALKYEYLYNDNIKNKKLLEAILNTVAKCLGKTDGL